MSSQPTLHIAVDNDIQLRLLELHHAQVYNDLINRNREALVAWMPWAAYENSLEQTQSFLQYKLRQFADGKGAQFGLWYQDQLVGALGLNDLDREDSKVEIGYWIDTSMQGKGLVTRASRALIAYAFHEYGLNKIEIHCATANKRSRAVAERLGFLHEGTIRQAQRLGDHFVDMAIYGMLASDWREGC
ncbi:GNAT family N-acetyltransferase [Ktedonobacter racemifer]|uniref:GCN5-related N-acetyltransferase n=1 Tax=Ktedonobacter racemifer DSM 44963 TaxID=485913 RepID=D6U1H9_KTERA|nr:GNAT family protein [Ktedonobacter racemifer]EFH82623.1 GCN5-related N-acetyltransferase [Ktedonobacter racemifer DSM 44963]